MMHRKRVLGKHLEIQRQAALARRLHHGPASIFIISSSRMLFMSGMRSGNLNDDIREQDYEGKKAAY
jgi:hypothetical protein